MDVSDRATIIMVMWAIWMSHNRCTHDQETIDPAYSVRRIREDLALLDIPGQAFIPWLATFRGKLHQDQHRCSDPSRHRHCRH